MPASHDSFAHLHEEPRMNKHRIKAAWMVLRGEWVAGPRPSPWTMTPVNTSNSAGSYTLTWNPDQFDAQRRFDARRAGRRAVRKHADALRRLSR